jgi:hypothetical protein
LEKNRIARGTREMKETRKYEDKKLEKEILVFRETTITRKKKSTC